MPQRNFVTHPLVLRELTVARVVDVTPRMRRVTLTGPQLREFTNAGFDLPAFVSRGFDDHVKLVFAEGGDLAEALPIQRAHSIDWPETGFTATRDYTPRRFDAERGELDLDFVRHGDGPAAGWAEQAKAGDALHIVGPKSSLVLPPDVEWMLLAGDETALPAIGRYLDERPDTFPVIVVVEIDDERAMQDFRLRDGDELHWIMPRGATSTTPVTLSDAVANLTLPDGVGYVWAAAESRALLPLRRWCTRVKGLPKTHVNITGYWHAADPASAPTADTAAAQAPAPAPAPDLDALLSPVPWFAARAALSTGLLDAVADAPKPLGRLADELTLDRGGLHVLAQVLGTFDAVAIHDGVVSLGPAGEQILEDEHLRESLDDTTESALILSLAHLDSSLRSGTPAHVLAYGATPTERTKDDPRRTQEAVDGGIGFDFVARGVADLETLPRGSSVAVTGPGSIAFSNALAGACAVTVVGSPVELAAARAAQPATDLAAVDTFAAANADVVASTLALAQRTDAEVIALLSELAIHAERAVVAELVLPTLVAPSDHDAEHAVLTYAATGSAPRSVADLELLAREAGWELARSTPLGWDHEALEFRRAR